ncbi:hypothetical protein TNCV_1529791 [Trichonephila clavipes]|uniref:Uncharacterized protein n=1 Tax=Trichonephila clavipes TaxID=2585209 RepID=A0A8X6SMK6_TRICX|nr:hypothetical protein TNCV_1529791 [Trichonephila clavipes]
MNCFIQKNFNTLLAIKIAAPKRRHATEVKFKLQEGAVICKLLAFQRIQTKQAPVATPTMCLNEEVVQPVSHTQIAFERCCLVKSYCDASCKKQKCVPVSNTEPYAGFQRPPITSSGEDRYVTRMALMDRAATSQALSQELGSFARQQVST